MPVAVTDDTKSKDEDVDNDTDESAYDHEAYAAAVALAVSAPKVRYDVSSSTPQFVVLSFDGSKSVDMLDETLAFEHKMQSEGKPLHFTYFINAAYFLSQETASMYQSPKKARGISNIGFSTYAKDIPLRVKAFNAAFAEGNEIGSHTVGHFDGTTWTYDDWSKEFGSFISIMTNVQKYNPSQQIDAPVFLENLHGFRAPYLAVNDGLYKTLADHHFTYDTSGIGPMDAWPHKDAHGIWNIPIGTIFVGANKSPVIAMDYSLYMHQSNAKDVAINGTNLWKTLNGDIESAYMDYFNTNYYGNRAPIIIGHHFTKWNDGAYWEAMKTFAENVCGKPQVKCVTYSELVSYLNTEGVPKKI